MLSEFTCLMSLDDIPSLPRIWLLEVVEFTVGCVKSFTHLTNYWMAKYSLNRNFANLEVIFHAQLSFQWFKCFSFARGITASSIELPLLHWKEKSKTSNREVPWFKVYDKPFCSILVGLPSKKLCLVDGCIDRESSSRYALILLCKDDDFGER